MSKTVLQPGVYVELETGHFWMRKPSGWFKMKIERRHPFRRPVGEIQRLVEPKTTRIQGNEQENRKNEPSETRTAKPEKLEDPGSRNDNVIH